MIGTSISFMFEAILIALLTVCLVAWISLRLARRVGLLDLPNSAPHKVHTEPTPLAGGIAFFITMLLAGWFSGTFQDKSVVAAFLGGAIVFFFGIWDDFKGISPQLKLVGQSLAVVVLVGMGVQVRIFESPEFFLGVSDQISIYLDLILTYVWIVGITNAFNFVDSTDGLAVGIAGLAAAFFTLVTLDAGQTILSYQSALILGACIGLYFFNSSPALLFLGDSGAQTLGFVLAVLGIAYRPLGANQSSSWVVPIMLLGIPIFDMTLVVLSRFRRRKPVYTAARDHTYHRLLALGINSNRAVVLMHIISLLLGCLAFMLLTRPPVFANAIFFTILLIGATGIYYLDSRKHWP